MGGTKRRLARKESKGPYKKVITEEYVKPVRQDNNNAFEYIRAINKVFAESYEIDPSVTMSALSQYRNLKTIGPNDLAMAKVVANITARVGRDSYTDYGNFLLDPDGYPKKVRVPGTLQNPLGTIVRNFRTYIDFKVTEGMGDIFFCYSPALFDFKNTQNQVAFFKIGPQSCGNPAQTSGAVFARMYQDYGLTTAQSLADYMYSGRKLGSALRISALVQTFQSGGAKIMCSPIITNTPPVQNTAADDYFQFAKGVYNKTPEFPGAAGIQAWEVSSDSLKSLTAGSVMDNRIIYDTDIGTGAQMVYLPTENSNFDFQGMGAGENSWSLGHKNRMDYVGIIRGLPAGARIEIWHSDYYEFNIRDNVYEILSSPHDMDKYTDGNLDQLFRFINAAKRNTKSFIHAPGTGSNRLIVGGEDIDYNELIDADEPFSKIFSRTQAKKAADIFKSHGWPMGNEELYNQFIIPFAKGKSKAVKFL